MLHVFKNDLNYKCSHFLQYRGRLLSRGCENFQLPFMRCIKYSLTLDSHSHVVCVDCIHHHRLWMGWWHLSLKSIVGSVCCVLGDFQLFPLQRMCQQVAATQRELADEIAHGGGTNSKHVSYFCCEQESFLVWSRNVNNTNPHALLQCINAVSRAFSLIHASR